MQEIIGLFTLCSQVSGKSVLPLAKLLKMRYNNSGGIGLWKLCIRFNRCLMRHPAF